MRQRGEGTCERHTGLGFSTAKRTAVSSPSNSTSRDVTWARSSTRRGRSWNLKSRCRKATSWSGAGVREPGARSRPERALRAPGSAPRHERRRSRLVSTGIPLSVSAARRRGHHASRSGLPGVASDRGRRAATEGVGARPRDRGGRCEPVSRGPDDGASRGARAHAGRGLYRSGKRGLAAFRGGHHRRTGQRAVAVTLLVLPLAYSFIVRKPPPSASDQDLESEAEAA